jgi:hypothetical protein
MLSTMHCIQLRLTRLTILINPVNTPHVFMEQSRDYDLFVHFLETLTILRKSHANMTYF